MKKLLDSILTNESSAERFLTDIVIVSRELVAAEGHYHRSSYRVYTKDTKTDIDKGEIILDPAECHEAAERMALIYKVNIYII